MLNKKIKDEILHCLKKERVHKIILFGSHAYGTPYADSDIDLIIVSDIKGMSKTYKDYLKNKNSISKKLLRIKKKYPLDLIVYTKDEWAFLKASRTSFIRAIEEKGVDLL
jgi:predicted nucleotidyltransferase